MALPLSSSVSAYAEIRFPNFARLHHGLAKARESMVTSSAMSRIQVTETEPGNAEPGDAQTFLLPNEGEVPGRLWRLELPGRPAAPMALPGRPAALPGRPMALPGLPKALAGRDWALVGRL